MGFWRNPRVNAGLIAMKLRDSRKQIRFFQRCKILPDSVTCNSCGDLVTKIMYKRKKFKCETCHTEVSVFRNTFMQNLKISIRKIVMLCYLFTTHPRMTQSKGNYWLALALWVALYIQYIFLNNSDTRGRSKWGWQFVLWTRGSPSKDLDSVQTEPNYTEVGNTDILQWFNFKSL